MSFSHVLEINAAKLPHASQVTFPTIHSQAFWFSVVIFIFFLVLLNYILQYKTFENSL